MKANVSDLYVLLTLARARGSYQKSSVRSLKSTNAQVAAKLPKANDPICKSIAEFTRYLLGYEETRKYPEKPTSDELIQLRQLTQSEIFADARVFRAPSPVITNDPHKFARFKILFTNDLRLNNITRFTFNWDNKSEHPWNRIVSIFVIKHWQFAKNERALKMVPPINPEDNTEFKCIEILLRWIRGRTVEINQHYSDPKKKLQRETNRKRGELFRYRRETMEYYLGKESLVFLPDRGCCSDTEWDPAAIEYPSIGLTWRHATYTKLLHLIDRLSLKHKQTILGHTDARHRFDQLRTEAAYSDSEARAYPGLPSNCYSRIYIEGLEVGTEEWLDAKPVSSLLESLIEKVENLLK